MRNSYAGAPVMEGLGRHYEIDVACRGEVHPIHSYLVDIKAIDRGVRELLVPEIEDACREFPGKSPASVLWSRARELNARLGRLVTRVRWYLTPTFSVEIDMSKPGKAILRQRFDFAASHRLNVASLSPEENARLFGKCNNPNGHGHNYLVEPSVEVDVEPHGRHALTLRQLEEIVDDVVLRRFDHKNLNLDTPEFADGRGLNPSVENIAKVVYELLAPEISRRCEGAFLRDVTVWESERTSSTYPG